MRRDPEKLERMEFGKAEQFGVEGEFFYNESDFRNWGQTRDDSVLDKNAPPATQPSLWCQWEPTEDRMKIRWDSGEKFYFPEAWMEYLITRILEPRGYTVMGTVTAEAEEFNERWTIQVANNRVSSTR
jgi:hypothetical protein